MRFKRLLALLLAAALALAVLVGCGSGQQSVASALLKLLDGRYPNISIEIDPELEADLRQAVHEGETDAEIRAALEKLLGSGVSFRLIGDGQKGDSAWNLILYPGSDPDAAARSAYLEWDKIFSAFPSSGLYTAKLSMIETDNGYAILVQATVDKAASRNDDDDDEPEEPKGPGYTVDDDGNYTVNTDDGLQNLFADTTINAASANITLESPVTLDASWPETITFTGELNGNGNTITMKGDRKQGLFNEIGEDGKVLNVDIEVSGTISGSGAVGGIAGTLRKGTVTGCSVTGGSISSSGSGSSGDVGGVVGWNSGGSVTACYSTGEVSGSYAGGVVGRNYDGGTVNDCYSTGTVSCGSSGGTAGGVVGRNSLYSSVTGCYHAVGEVSGVFAGGVVGWNDSSTVTACYSTNPVTGSSNGRIGGVVGNNSDGGTVTACYHAGAVSGDAVAGGVVGKNDNDAFGSGTVNNCYWSGTPEKGIGDANESNPDTTTEITEDNANTAWDALVEAMKVEGYTLKGSWTNPSFE